MPLTAHFFEDCWLTSLFGINCNCLTGFSFFYYCSNNGTLGQKPKKMSLRVYSTHWHYRKFWSEILFDKNFFDFENLKKSLNHAWSDKQIEIFFFQTLEIFLKLNVFFLQKNHSLSRRTEQTFFGLLSQCERTTQTSRGSRGTFFRNNWFTNDMDDGSRGIP